jgi:hypothetical protein
VGKILKGIIGVFALALAFTPLGLAVIGPMTAATTASIAAIGISMSLSVVAEALFGPKTPKTQLSRLNVSLDPSTPRKAVLGTTAMPLDLRYHESSGTNQEYIDYIICVAAHKVKSISEIWFEEKIAWTSAGGVDYRYSGYLTVSTVLEGNSSNYISINGGAKWGSTRRLTGCAYVHLRIKRTGNDKKAESPVVNGLPSRVTITGEGAYMYDPRKDSTVTGGSGSHRANDQTTWGTYTNADDVDNPALQLLWWLLGWKINSKLSVGCGVPSTRLDLESFITAANICDEDITLSGGGTQKRYRTSATASDADNRMDIINTFLSCMNGTLRDNDGKLTLTVMKNDLANYVLSFDDDDVLEDFEWNQTRGITDTYNVARGRYVDPSNNSLYQMLDYPEIRIDSIDGLERVVTIDLPYVEDGKRAQRIAKQVLQRNQYRGMFSAIFSAKALGCQVGDVVRLTFAPLGWTNKLFRVISQQIDFTGKVPLALVEENAAIYAWDANESAPVTPTAPTIYDPLNNPLILGIDEAGANATVGYLTNEAHQVATDANGNGGDYSNAGGTFYVLDNAVDVTTLCTFNITATTGGLTITGTPNISINASGVYTITDLTADEGTATIEATFGTVTIEKVYSIVKSKSAKTLMVSTNRYTIVYDSSGNPTPTTQTTTFTTTKQNTTATVTWSLTDSNGVARTPVTNYLSSATGDTVTMTEAQFASARNSTSGVIVTGTAVDGSITLTDKISVVRVASGANGTNGTNGTNGANGTRTANLYMYKWSSTTPTTWPSGTVTYTWETATFTNPATLNGWSRTIGTPSAGDKLWRITQVYTDTDTSLTDTVTWTGTYTPEQYTPTLGDLAALNSVGTVKIDANAVTNLTSAYTAAAYDASFGPYLAAATWNTVQTITLTTTGAPVVIKGGMNLFYNDGNSSAICQIKIQKDGVDWAGPFMLSSPIIGTSVYFTFLGTISLTDVPSAGSHTYTLQLYMTESSSGYYYRVSDRYLEVLETKR